MIDDNGGSQTAKELLRTLALSIPYVGNRNTNGEGQPLLILCPQHARLLGNGGYSKAEVKRFIWEYGRLPFGSIPRGNLTNFSEKILKMYADFDSDFGVPIADKPEDIVIGHGRDRHSQPVGANAARVGERHHTDTVQGRDAVESKGVSSPSRSI